MLDNVPGASNSLFERIVITSPMTIASDNSVMDAIAQMHQANCSYALVLDKKSADKESKLPLNRELLGIFTERDLVRAVASAHPFEEMPIASAVVNCPPAIAATDIKSAAEIFLMMRQQRTNYLSVVDSCEQLIGIITKRSLRQALTAPSLLRFKSVSEVMVRQVFCLVQSASVLRAAQLMSSKDVSCVVVLDQAELPIGIITERDIVQFKALSLDVRSTAVGEVMSTPLLPVLCEDSLWDAHQKMSQYRVRRLVVRSSEGRLAGLVTQTSILQALGSEDSQQMVELLHHEVLQLRSENQALLESRNRELEKAKNLLSTQLEDKQVEQQQTQAQLRAAYKQLEASHRALTTTNQELNKTLQELQRTEQALQQSNAELESRVETRTLDFRRAERRWRSLLENVHLVVIGLNLDGRVNYANPFFLKLTGYSAPEVLEKDWFEAFVSRNDYAHTYQYFQALIREDDLPLRYQNAILTRLGTERIIHWNNTVLRDRADKTIGIMSIGEDITERLAVDRMKGEFVAVVSHELRTPLTAIHGSLQLITSGLVESDSTQGQDLLQVAAESSLRLVRLVNDILELERLESGKVQLDRTKINSQQITHQVARTLAVAAQDSKIAIAVFDPGVWVFADGDRLIQVLTNLIDNAIKFSPENSAIDISVEPVNKPLLGATSAPEKSNGMALFKVKDQGRGIPPENRSKIFERFTQVNYADSRDKGGTGLGLAICYNIVRQHGGRIWVESTLGEGSCFFFTLPLYRDIGKGVI